MTTTHDRARWAVPLALAAVYLIWGSTYLGQRLALSGIPPLLMAGSRFVVAGAALLLIGRLRHEPLPSARQWGGAALTGLLFFAVGNTFVVLAQTQVASGLAAVMVAAMPLWAALFSGLFGQWPRALEWVGLVIGLSGVALLNLDAELAARPMGALLLTVAPMAWALGTVWSRRLPLPSGVTASAAQMLTGGALLLPLAALRGERLTAPPPLGAVLAWLYLIAFGSLIAFSAFLYLLRHAPGPVATSYAYVNPAIAVLLGGAFGEPITLHAIGGMVVILAGIGLVLWPRAREINERLPDPTPKVQ